MRILLCVLLVCFVAWKPTTGDRPKKIDPSLISFGPGGEEGMQQLFEASLDAFIERDPVRGYALVLAMEEATKIEDKEEQEREFQKLFRVMFSQTSPEDEDVAEELKAANERGEL